MLELTGVGKFFGTRQVFADVALALDAGSIKFDGAELTQLSDDTLTLLQNASRKWFRQSTSDKCLYDRRSWLPEWSASCPESRTRAGNHRSDTSSIP